MIVDPDFFTHWKTRIVQNELGNDGVLAVLKLWAFCHSRRQDVFELTPRKLAGICDWSGDPQALFDVLTAEDSFLDRLEPDENVNRDFVPTLDPLCESGNPDEMGLSTHFDPHGIFRVHDWREVNRALTSKWNNQNARKQGLSNESNTSRIRNENDSLSSLPFSSLPKVGSKKAKKGTLEELQNYCQSIGLPASDGETLFHQWEGNGWTNNGGPIRSWKSTIQAWRGKGYLASQKSANGNGSTDSGFSTIKL